MRVDIFMILLVDRLRNCALWRLGFWGLFVLWELVVFGLDYGLRVCLRAFKCLWGVGGYSA